jgi:drug/metabolite transporter (DMT)-like permease
VIYGLIAAAGWGLSAVAAANATRRTGTYLAVLNSQGAGVVLLIILAAVLPSALHSVSAATAIGLAGAGLAGLLAYLAFYRALEYGGAVGLVSAINATYGGITTVLAVVFLGERISGTGIGGILLAVTGIAVSSAAPRTPVRPAEEAVTEAAAGTAPAAAGTAPAATAIAPAAARARRLSRAGIPLALVSATGYGVSGFLLGDYAGRAGPLESALGAHGVLVLVLLLALPFLGKRTVSRLDTPGVLWAVAAGLADAAGLLAFALGGQANQVAITSAVSSIYPTVPLVAAIVLFGERLSRQQLLGTALIITGLILIGLS